MDMMVKMILFEHKLFQSEYVWIKESSYLWNRGKINAIDIII